MHSLLCARDVFGYLPSQQEVPDGAWGALMMLCLASCCFTAEQDCLWSSQNAAGLGAHTMSACLTTADSRLQVFHPAWFKGPMGLLPPPAEQ